MKRNLRALGFIVVVLLGGATGPVAAAEGFAFDSVAPHTSLTGHQTSTQTFTAEAGSATCKTMSYSGELAAEEASEVVLTPSFSECTADPAGTASVAMNGCRFVLTPGTKEGTTYRANLSLSCETGKLVTITVTVFGTVACTVDIPAQKFGEATLKEVSGEEETTDIGMTANTEGIKYTQTAGKGLAPCSSGEKTNGTYKGESVIAGSFLELEEKFAVPIGMEALKPAIDVEPVESLFDVNAKGDITVQNISGAKLTILVAQADQNYFKPIDDKCTKQAVDKDKNCVVKIECTKAFAGIAFFNAISDKPRDVDAAILRCS